MKRLHALVAAAGAAAFAMSGVVAPAAQGAVPEYQRVIKARSAFAASAVTEGCLETRVWISSSASVFGGRPGPISKQGLTTVLVERFDTCQVAAAAGGEPPGVLVFEGMGQTRYPLGSTPRFTEAWVRTTVPVLDEISGETVPVRLDLTWRPSEPFQRDTISTHARDPHAGIVNAHSQTLMVAASVNGTVTTGADATSWPNADEASLEQVKYGCQLIRHPHGSTDFSC